MEKKGGDGIITFQSSGLNYATGDPCNDFQNEQLLQRKLSTRP